LDIQTLSGLGTATGGFRNGSLIGLDTTNAGGNFNYNQVLANPNGGANVLGLTKLGTGSLTFGALNTYTGATNINAGAIIVPTNTSIASQATPAGAMVVGLPGSAGGNNAGGATTPGGQTAALSVTGGSVNIASMNINNENITGVTISSGTINVTNTLAVNNDSVNLVGLLLINGGTVNAGSVTLGRTNLNNGTTVQTAGQTNRGIYVNGGALNITNTLVLGPNTNAASSPNMRIDSGSVTVGGTTTITVNNARYSVLDVNGGTFTSNDATGAGIQIGGNFAAVDAEFLIRGTGVVTTNKITFGNATQTSGADLLQLSSGTLYVGSGGIVTGGATGTTTPFNVGTTALATSPILGAIANWSSSMPMALALSSGGISPTIQAADGSNVAHDIALSGVLSGTSGLTKTGGGTLTLSAANSYTNLTTISGGTISTGATGTLPNGGSNSSIGKSSNAAANLVLDGGTLQWASTQVGASFSTDRLFTITQNGGGLDASGTNPITFAGNGVGAANTIATSGSGPRTFTLKGSNTSANTLAPIIADGAGGATSLSKSGTGSWTVSAANTFTGNVTVSGGTLTLSGANVYTGVTSITGGKLVLSSTGSLGNTAISASGGGTFAANPGSGSTTIGTNAASMTIGAGSTFTMQDGAIGTVNLNAAGGGSALVLGLGGTSLSPSTFNFDLGSTGADQLVVNNGTVQVVVGATPQNNITLNTVGGTAPSILTGIPLINDPNGTLTLSNYSIQQLPVVFGSTAYAPSLSLGAGNHSLLLNLTQTSLAYYWKGGNGASWATANNFATDQNGTTLRPSAPTVGSNVFLTANSASNFAQTLDGSYSINSLNFAGSGTSAATNSITLSDGSGTNTLTLTAGSSFQDSANNTYPAGTGLVVQSGSAAHTISVSNLVLGAAQTWQNNSANKLTVSSVVSGDPSNRLTVSGTGTIKLSGNNIYQGGTTLNSGTLQLGHANALGTGGVVVNGGTLDLHGFSPTFSSLSGSGGAITTTSTDPTLTISTGATPATYAGSIQDGSSSIAVVITGTGTQNFSGSNAYTGGTTLSSGTLGIASDAGINNGTGGITFGGGTLQFNNYASTNLPSPLLSNVPSLKLGAATGSGSRLDTVIGGTSILTFVGPGNLQLFASNTYTGGTNINGGTLNLGTSENAGTSGPLGASGNITFGGGAIQYTASNQFDYTPRILNSTGAIAIDTAGQDVTFNGAIDPSNTGGLTKLGAGSLTLTNSNNYGGLTTVSAGTLNANNNAALGSPSAVTSGLRINPDNAVTATVNFTTSAPVIASLASAAGANGTGTSNVVLGNATLGAATTLTVGGNGNNTNFGGTISDANASIAATGSLIKLGIGTLTLSGPNTYTGTAASLTSTNVPANSITGNNTIVGNGNLNVNAGGSIGAGATSGPMTVGMPGSNNTAGGAPASLNVNGGTVTATQLTVNNETGSPAISLTNNGTINVTGALRMNNDNVNLAASISLTSGTLNANSVTMGRTDLQNTALQTTGSNNRGIFINGAAMNVATTMTLGTSNSAANLRMDSGSLTVGGTTIITINNGGRYSVLDVGGGTFTSNDTTGAGIQLGGNFAASSDELIVRGGQVNTNTITFGTATQTSGNNVLEFYGGTVYVGAGGLANGGSSVTGTINLGLSTATTAPLLAASANWSSSQNLTMNLAANTTAVNPTIQAADANNVAKDITFAGQIVGAAGLIKTGGGTLTLTGPNSYGGGTFVNAGNLRGNTDGLQGTITTVDASQTVTIDQGTVVNGGGTNASISGPSKLVKTGAGAATLSNQNSYTGNTTVSQGALILGTNEAISSTSKVILAGGTLGTNGQNQTFSSAALSVTSSSKIDVGQSGSNDTLHFADSHSETWGASSLGSLLRIDNWTPTDQFTQGDHITFDGSPGLTGSPTTGQLSQIHFTGFKGTAQLVSGELLPSTNTVLTRGDLTLNGAIAMDDLTKLEQVLTDVNSYKTANGLNDADVLDLADVDRDGAMTNGDVQAEIYLLINGFLPPIPGPSPGSVPSGAASVPEPGSLLLMAIAALAVAESTRRRAKGVRREII
jgi:autotransporter-associated beta strand protein